MTVVITNEDGEVRRVRIPAWHTELFWDDPYEYMAPFLRGMGPSAEWDIL